MRGRFGTVGDAASWLRRRWWRASIPTFAALMLAAVHAPPAAALPITVSYADGPGEGFNDPTLGAERRAAFAFAADVWARTLVGNVPIVIVASMNSLGGNGTDAILAQTRATTLHRNFSLGVPDTWYPAALASQLNRNDINGAGAPEIQVVFNGDIDSPSTLGSIDWYYGTDAQPGADIDLVTVALHEIGHGLGFFELVDLATGRYSFGGDPAVFDRQLFRPGLGLLFKARDAERLAAVTSGHLLWVGAEVAKAFGEPPPIYAPNPAEAGSSLAHWDVSLDPDELIEPFYKGANHDLGLLLPALIDMGWESAAPTPTPRGPSATATATATDGGRPTRTPTRPPIARREVAYVTNFDSGTVSVIDVNAMEMRKTLAVGQGPIGVAASPHGTRAYVANFRSGTLSVIDTIEERILRTIPVGESPNKIAVDRGGRTAYVSDTSASAVAVVDLERMRVVKSLAVEQQPSGIAIDVDSRYVFVAGFGSNLISVIDTRSNEVTGRIVSGAPSSSGSLSIGMNFKERFFILTNAFEPNLVVIKVYELNGFSFSIRFDVATAIRSVAVAPNGLEAYLTAHEENGAGRLVIVDPDAEEITGTISVGDRPEGLAVTADGSRVWVANSGSDAISIVDVGRRREVASIAAGGSAPLEIAFVSVPASACAGDCNADNLVTVHELLRGVNIALGTRSLRDCPTFDADGGRLVTVDELVAAAYNSLTGCWASP